MVRTLPSQGRNTGSIPVRATKGDFVKTKSLFCLIIEKIYGSIFYINFSLKSPYANGNRTRLTYI